MTTITKTTASILARPGMNEGLALRMRELHREARQPFPFDRCATFHTERMRIWDAVLSVYAWHRRRDDILSRCG